jgi:hypothetical protein
MNDHQPSTLLAKCWADRIRLIAIETMKGAFGSEGALLPFCDKNMGVGANGLADLEKRFGFTFRCFPDAASLGFS